MKEINLVDSNLKALVDDEDYESLSTFRWRILTNGDKSYAITGLHRENTEMLMHHVLLPKGVGYQTDHKDGNGLNNQKYNLRYATVNQNQYNRGKTKANTSGFKGVFYAYASGNWRSQIKVDGKLIYLGTYKTPERAALAYNEGARKYHGEFAYQNPL